MISNASLTAAIKRSLLTFFRVGMFDSSNAQNPYAGPCDESQLDGAAHRALARAAVARTTVMLENRAVGASGIPLP